MDVEFARHSLGINNKLIKITQGQRVPGLPIEMTLSMNGRIFPNAEYDVTVGSEPLQWTPLQLRYLLCMNVMLVELSNSHVDLWLDLVPTLILLLSSKSFLRDCRRSPRKFPKFLFVFWRLATGQISRCYQGNRNQSFPSFFYILLDLEADCSILRIFRLRDLLILSHVIRNSKSPPRRTFLWTQRTEERDPRSWLKWKHLSLAERRWFEKRYDLGKNTRWH